MFNLTDKYQQKMDIISNHSITLGGRSFIGKITDFNVWSRILSIQEISSYSLGCDQNFVKLSNPENMLWTAVNITSQGSNTRQVIVSVNEFCQSGDESRRAIIIVPEITEYDTSANFCNEINGKLFYPTNEQNLDWFMSSYDRYINEECSEPWKRAEQIETDTTMTCMFFNVSSLEYVESMCTKKVCAFCQIEEKRLKFTFKTSCKDLDEEYFLVQEKSQSKVYFLGVGGLTQIMRDSSEAKCWYCWTVESLSYLQESEKYVAILEGDIFSYFYPFGLYTWNSTLDCVTTKQNWEPMKFKFNNVS